MKLEELPTFLSMLKSAGISRFEGFGVSVDFGGSAQELKRPTLEEQKQYEDAVRLYEQFIKFGASEGMP